MKNIIKILTYIGLSTSFTILFVISNLVQGVVLSYLWEWFARPLGAGKLSIIHAIGLSILFDFVSFHYYDYKKSEEVGMITAVQFIVIRPALAFLVGFLVHLIMTI